MLKYYQQLSEKVYNNSILLYCLFFIIGIISYFSLLIEINITLVILTLIIFSCIYYYKKNFIILYIIYFLIGFFIATFHTVVKNRDFIQEKIHNIKIQAKIDAIEMHHNKTRLILSDIHSKDNKDIKNINRIRMNIIYNNPDLSAGDIIETTVNIMPLSSPILFNGYNMSLWGYFNNIDATSYNISKIKIIEKKSKDIASIIDNIRNHITYRLIEILGNETGSIATALIVGNKNLIPQDIMENIRSAGLAHLMAISGMHMLLVTSIIFVLTRTIMLPFLSLNHKKISAIITLLAGFFYLLITGSPISAQRAYLMISIYLVGIIFNQISYAHRCVIIACFIKLAIYPETILSAGFQMSFMAVFFLIYFSDVFVIKNHHKYRFLVFIYEIIKASLLATIATLPFALYHFNSFSPYGIFSNIIAIPITTVVIMPFAVIGTIFNLDIAYIIMGFGIKIIVYISEFFANLDYSKINFVIFEPITILILAFSSILFAIFNILVVRITLLFVTILLFIYLQSSFIIPDIIVQDYKNFVVKDSNNYLLTNQSTSLSNYHKEVWQKYYKGYKSEYNKNFYCSKKFCYYLKDGFKVIFILQYDSQYLDIKKYCNRYDLIILLSKKINSDQILQCRDKIIINNDIKSKGVYYIYINDNIIIQNIRDHIGNRPWNLIKSEHY